LPSGPHLGGSEGAASPGQHGQNQQNVFDTPEVPFKVTADRGDRLLLYYLGGSGPKARELGLTVEGRSVASGVIPKSEIENPREVDTVIWPESATIQ